MASLKQVLIAVAATVGKTGLRCTDHVPGQITPPQGVVTVPPVDYDQGFSRDGGVLRVVLTVLVSDTLDQQGQHLLSEYADVTGPKSIKAILDANRDLGGVVNDARLSSFAPLGRTAVGVLGFFGGEFTIPIIIRGA